MRRLLLVAALAALRATGQTVADINGTVQHPMAPPAGKVSALFFITTDCPISNFYAAEIRRICTVNGGRVNCFLVYTDPFLDKATIAKHKSAFGHGEYPAIFDQRQVLVKALGATVTPEAALVNSAGELVYRGRIDDSYATWGKRRAVVREHNLTDAMAATLAGKPVAQPRTKATGCFITPLEMLKSAAR